MRLGHPQQLLCCLRHWIDVHSGSNPTSLFGSTLLCLVVFWIFFHFFLIWMIQWQLTSNIWSKTKGIDIINSGYFISGSIKAQSGSPVASLWLCCGWHWPHPAHSRMPCGLQQVSLNIPHWTSLSCFLISSPHSHHVHYVTPAATSPGPTLAGPTYWSFIRFWCFQFTLISTMSHSISHNI